MDLSCISKEDWQRLERASRGDERELTARIMLLAYLAKANGHSTFDAVLPPDLTAREANRLADQLVIGDGQGRGAPGRRARMRLVGSPEALSPPERRVTRPSIIRWLEAAAVCLVAVAAVSLPWGFASAPDVALLTVTFAACAILTRGVALGFSIAYLLTAAAYSEPLLRASLPGEIFLGFGALVAMAAWTLLLQPQFKASPRIRQLAWVGIAASAFTALTATVFQVQTMPVWVPLLVAAIGCTAVRCSALDRLAGSLARVNLVAAMPAVAILPLALLLPNGGSSLKPLWVAESLFGLAALGTTVALVILRRDRVTWLPKHDARSWSVLRPDLPSFLGRGLATATVGAGAAIALCLLPYAPERLAENFDIYWLAATFGIASILMLRTEPFVAVFFALAGASFAESVVRSEIAAWPQMQLLYGSAFGMWLLVTSRAPQRGRTRRILQGMTCLAGITWLAAIGGLVSHPGFWAFSLTAATLVGIRRAFETGVMSEPRLALAVAGFLPTCAELTLHALGFELPRYGTAYIGFTNLWLSLAPIGCILFYLARLLHQPERAIHGSSD